MNRRGFLKFFGKTAAVAAIAPTVIAELKPNTAPFPRVPSKDAEDVRALGKLMSEKIGDIYPSRLTTPIKLNPDDFRDEDFWRERGKKAGLAARNKMIESLIKTGEQFYGKPS